jgi:hypothetical protein
VHTPAARAEPPIWIGAGTMCVIANMDD